MYDYKSNPEYFGYFDDPTQKEPKYDPLREAPCLICSKPHTSETVRTITFLVEGGSICYFYRVHRACHDGLGSDEQRQEFEWRIQESTL